MKRRQFRASAPDALYAIKPEAFGFFFLSSSATANEVTDDGVAIVNINGPLEQRAGWFDGYDAIRERFDEALADENAHTIVMRIDSPGGEVAGLFEAVEAMRASKKAHGKRVVAYADEGAYSAAYTLACVADEIYLPASGGVGSCGVITSAYDVTKANERAGVRVAVVASGARKTDGHPDVPLTDEAIASIRKRVDGLASQLFETVAAARPLSADEVRSLEAACLYGDEAVDEGLADGVMGFDALLAKLSERESTNATGAMPTTKGSNMKRKTLAVLPALAAAAVLATGAPIITPTAEAPAEEEDEEEEEEGGGTSTTTTTTTTTETEPAKGESDDDAEEEEEEEEAHAPTPTPAAAAPAPVPSAITSKDVLAFVRGVTGKVAPFEILGALQSIVNDAAEVASLRAKDAKRTVAAIVDKAIGAGQITPAQKKWAVALGVKDRASLDAFLASSAPKVAPVAIGANDGAKQKAPTAASLGGEVDEHGLTAGERKIAASMGVSPAEFAKTKASIGKAPALVVH